MMDAHMRTAAVVHMQPPTARGLFSRNWLQTFTFHFHRYDTCHIATLGDVMAALEHFNRGSSSTTSDDGMGRQGGISRSSSSGTLPKGYAPPPAPPPPGSGDDDAQEGMESDGNDILPPLPSGKAGEKKPSFARASNSTLPKGFIPPPPPPGGDDGEESSDHHSQASDGMSTNNVLLHDEATDHLASEDTYVDVDGEEDNVSVNRNANQNRIQSEDPADMFASLMETMAAEEETDPSFVRRLASTCP
jgi:hypothetical protein